MRRMRARRFMGERTVHWLDRSKIQISLKYRKWPVFAASPPLQAGLVNYLDCTSFSLPTIGVVLDSRFKADI